MWYIIPFLVRSSYFWLLNCPCWSSHIELLFTSFNSFPSLTRRADSLSRLPERNDIESIMLIRGRFSLSEWSHNFIPRTCSLLSGITESLSKHSKSRSNKWLSNPIKQNYNTSYHNISYLSNCEHKYSFRVGSSFLDYRLYTQHHGKF